MDEINDNNNGNYINSTQTTDHVTSNVQITPFHTRLHTIGSNEYILQEDAFNNTTQAYTNKLPFTQLLLPLPQVSLPLLDAPSILHTKFRSYYGSNPGTIVDPTEEHQILLQQYLDTTEFQTSPYILEWKKIFYNKMIPNNLPPTQTNSSPKGR